MEKNVLLPTNDYVFKRIFSKVGNERITKGFLNAILDFKVEEVNLEQNTITERELYDDKVGVFDLRAKLNNNVLCNVEMQMLNQKFLDKRILFYWSKLYTSSIKKNENYGALKKSIVILIANFELPELSDIPYGHTEWKIYEKNFPKILTDDLEIHILSLPKIKRMIENGEFLDNKLKSWMKFLINPKEMEESDMTENDELREAMEIFDDIERDDHDRELAWLRMKHILDTNSIRSDGFEDGFKDGMETKKIEIAKKMLKKSMDINEISDITGLSVEEIEKLK